ncbi:MAG: hypothetical protein QXZ68_04750 [Candidatus Bathyarchaeia archaeon]
MVKFTEPFDTIDPAKWAIWTGAGTLNKYEIVNGRLHCQSLFEGYNGYIVLSSTKPYLMMNNGVEIEFEMAKTSVGFIALSIAPYNIRRGQPLYVLRNYDAILFRIDHLGNHTVDFWNARGGVVSVQRIPVSSDIFSGKLAIRNRNRENSFFFNGQKFGSISELPNMNTAIFVVAEPMGGYTPGVVDVYVDNLTIEDISIGMLSEQWVGFLNLMMVVIMMSVISSIIKQVKKVREK